MIEAKTKTICGNEYQVTQFRAPRALRLFFKLTKIAGPGIAGGFSGVKNVKELLDAEVNIGQLISSLLERIDEEEVTDLIMTFFSATHRNRKDLSVEDNFSEAFTGNYGEMISALLFVGEVNYGSFFGKAGATGSQAPESKKAKKGLCREG